MPAPAISPEPKEPGSRRRRLDRVAGVLVMGAPRPAPHVDGVLPPVDVVEAVEKLQPGDLALVYLNGAGPAPAVQAPIGVIDLVDDVDELQPGDTTLIYLPGSTPSLVAGTVESITPPDRKRPVHNVTFTAPVTDDPTSTQLAITTYVTPESADGTGVLVHGYRVNMARVRRRARLAGHSVADDTTSSTEAPPLRAVPEPAIVFGTIGSLSRWGITDPGHMISYTKPAFDDGSHEFPINLPSIQAFISGYRTRTV